MHLVVNGFSLPIRQMGPDFLLLETPVNHPPAPANIVMQVDQNERTWAVSLPEGISAQSNRVRIAAE